MKTAFRDQTCEDCADLIMEGDPIYFTDEGKLCLRCADRDHLVCPSCQSQKTAKYKLCFQCDRGESGRVGRAGKTIKVKSKGH